MLRIDLGMIFPAEQGGASGLEFQCQLGNNRNKNISRCNILACTFIHLPAIFWLVLLVVNPLKVAKLPITLTLVEYVNGKIETTVR